MKTLSASDLKFVESQLVTMQTMCPAHNEKEFAKLSLVISKIRAVTKFEKAKRANIAPGGACHYKEFRTKPLSVHYSYDELFKRCRVKMRVTSNLNFDIRNIGIANTIVEFKQFKKVISLKLADCPASEIDSLKMKISLVDGCISNIKAYQGVKMQCDISQPEPYYYIPKAVVYDQQPAAL
jgi:hypothetical protein